MDGRSEFPDLFPRIEPFETGMLAVGDGHDLYWEQSGNPDGQPVVFLHGGPGAGAGPIHRRFFDPQFYRIIVFDQRGAGRSRPFAAVEQNTTRHLIDDMERLRRHLGIERWMVFGGSWGSALALAYGLRHRDRCAGFVLRGIFLGRRFETQWFLEGMRMVFPEAWRAFAGHLSDSERDTLLVSYHRRLTDPDPAVHLPAARAWSQYESACSNLLPRTGGMTGAATVAEDRAALTLARIEAHYFINDLFLPAGHLLRNAEALRAIPTVIVQGRYDMVCPIATADELASRWPEADYVIVPDAGHSAMEPGIRSALVRATEKMKAAL